MCSQVNQTGLSASREFEILEMVPYFFHSEGVNQYFKHNYADAITKLVGTLPDIRANKDFANETVAYFYIGKSYWSQNQKEIALFFFRKVDYAFEKENYMRPDLREAYELLINYYKQQNNKEAQLLYINKLLRVDQLLGRNYKYLSGKIFKEYDTKKLLQAKLDIENTMRLRTVFSTIVIVFLGFIIAFLISRHFKNKRLFEELINRKPDNIKTIVSGNNGKETLDINPEVVATILKNIEKFERNKKYLDKDVNLVKLASLLNTNTKYASKIIARYHDKGTIEYVSDLKIDHIVELLKNENKYRNYTNKAPGEEAGFGS